jgi:AcrR family transcriptional regulator
VKSATPSRKRRARLGRPPGPPSDPEQRRAELIEAAARAIRRIGPHASMTEIAREAGLTKPILYSHFGDKAGLGVALAERFTQAMVPEVLGALQAERAPIESVRGAISAFIAFVEAEPDVYRFLVRGIASADAAFVEQYLVQSFGLQIARVLRTGLLDADADSGPSELWSFAILGAVFAGAEWWLARPTMSRDDLVDYLTSLVWGGLSRTGIERLTPEAT